MLDKSNLQGLCPLTLSGLCPEPSKGASPFANPFYRSPLGRRKKPCFSLFGNSFWGGHATRGKGYAWAETFLLNAASGYKIFSAHPFPLQGGSLIVFGHDGAVGKGFCRLRRQVRFPLHHAGGGSGGHTAPSVTPSFVSVLGVLFDLSKRPL